MNRAIDNRTVREKIDARFYHIDYPSGVTGHLRKAAIQQYRAAVREQELVFKADLADEYGLTGHPKADKVFEFAWREGHSEGYQRVAEWYGELAELVL